MDGAAAEGEDGVGDLAEGAAAGEVGDGDIGRTAFRLGVGDDEQRCPGHRRRGAERTHHFFDRCADGEVRDVVDDEDVSLAFGNRVEDPVADVAVDVAFERVRNVGADVEAGQTEAAGEFVLFNVFLVGIGPAGIEPAELFGQAFEIEVDDAVRFLDRRQAVDRTLRAAGDDLSDLRCQQAFADAGFAR